MQGAEAECLLLAPGRPNYWTSGLLLRIKASRKSFQVIVVLIAPLQI